VPRMTEQLLSDELWNEVISLLPAHKRNPRGGRPFKSDRQCLEGILYVLKTGCQWKQLPTCEGWPSGVTCWRRLRDWTASGVWPRLHRKLLDRLGFAGMIDAEHVVVDSESVRAKKGARTPAPAL
jgi:transposase